MFYIYILMPYIVLMIKTDTRNLAPIAQEGLRIRAVKAVLSGKKIVEVSRAFSVSRVSIINWLKIYRAKGMGGLKSSKRGLKKGQGRVLSEQQCRKIRSIVVDKLPEQLKMPFVLWTRKAVRELIHERFGFWMPIRTVGEYLKRWGFTAQKPAKSSYEQQPKVVKQWLDVDYPKLKKKAEKEGAMIHWGDETGFKNQCHVGRSYAPKGKTPSVKKMGQKFSTNMISSISNQGEVRFMIYDGKMNAQTLIKFLKRLIQSSKKKVLLILDNLKVHHAYLVRDWVSEHKDEIEIFFTLLQSRAQSR